MPNIENYEILVLGSGEAGKWAAWTMADEGHRTLCGIVTSLDPKRGGQAMGLNVFALFTGFGSAAFFSARGLKMGFGRALAMFSVVQLIAAAGAIRLFARERPIID